MPKHEKNTPEYVRDLAKATYTMERMLYAEHGVYKDLWERYPDFAKEHGLPDPDLIDELGNAMRDKNVASQIMDVADLLEENNG